MSVEVCINHYSAIKFVNFSHRLYIVSPFGKKIMKCLKMTVKLRGDCSLF